MKRLRSVSSLALLAAALGANAATLTLNQPTIGSPVAGSATYFITGTLVLEANETIYGIEYDLRAFSPMLASLMIPSNGINIASTNFLERYENVESDVRRVIAGNFLTFTVEAGTPVAYYDRREPDVFAAPSALTVLYFDANRVADSEVADIRVNVVPGPTAALPFALMALRRRRRA